MACFVVEYYPKHLFFRNAQKTLEELSCNPLEYHFPHQLLVPYLYRRVASLTIKDSRSLKCFNDAAFYLILQNFSILFGNKKFTNFSFGASALGAALHIPRTEGQLYGTLTQEGPVTVRFCILGICNVYRACKGL